MNERPVALVTGANRGIGQQIASDLAGHGFTVLVAARDIRRGEEAASRIPGARAIALDVTDAATIAAAAERIRSELGRLDVLVNNAGIVQRGGTTIEGIIESGRPSAMALDEVRRIFETNVLGVIAVTQAMLPLLREAPAGRIVNISSGAGSMNNVSSPVYPMPRVGGVAYGPSKSALNAVTIAFAQELAETRILVNAVCPGFTATDFNGNTGTRSVAEGARRPVRMALLGPDGPTGTFSNEAGPLPW